MYCSKCGAAVSEGQAFCSRCGHATGIALGAAASELAELMRFKRIVRRLSRYWYLFAGLNVVLGVMGLIAVQTGLSMQTGPWEPWPHPYIWNWTLTGDLGWMLLFWRIVAAIATGWGLGRLTDWSKPVTWIAAGFAFLEFPIGFALAIYTVTVLMGRHHVQLYSRIAAGGMRAGNSMTSK